MPRTKQKQTKNLLRAENGNKKKKDMWLHFCSYKYISIYYYGIKFISMDRALNVFGVLVSEQFSKDFFFFFGECGPCILQCQRPRLNLKVFSCHTSSTACKHGLTGAVLHPRTPKDPGAPWEHC